MASIPPSSGAEDSPPDGKPSRIWDPERQVYVEAQTICRDTLGRYAEKLGDEPGSQLMLPFN
jgi:hypothetical protein